MTVEASPLIRIIGRNMELLALKRGWSLNDLAERGDTPVGHLRKLRDGHLRYIDPDAIEGIMTALNIQPNDLMLPMEDVVYD